MNKQTLTRAKNRAKQAVKHFRANAKEAADAYNLLADQVNDHAAARRRLKYSQNILVIVDIPVLSPVQFKDLME